MNYITFLPLLLLSSAEACEGLTGVNWAPSTVPDIDQLKCLKTYRYHGEPATNHTFMILQGFHSLRPDFHHCSALDPIAINQTIRNAKQVGFNYFDVYMDPSPICQTSATMQVEEMGESACLPDNPQ